MCLQAAFVPHSVLVKHAEVVTVGPEGESYTTLTSTEPVTGLAQVGSGATDGLLNETAGLAFAPFGTARVEIPTSAKVAMNATSLVNCSRFVLHIFAKNSRVLVRFARARVRPPPAPHKIPPGSKQPSFGDREN
jgi:hypothetical protein